MTDSAENDRPDVTDVPCPACSAPVGTPCTVRLSGVDTAGWSHDARIMAPIYADLLDAVAVAPPSQYGLQVLVNADTRSARWAFHEDYPLSDSEADAWRYLKDALDSGYAPHHLRVVALHVVEPR